MESRSRPAHAVGIALVAAGVLAYQIVLMRTFAIESYASFGAMVISVAMLGFGLSGTLLTVFRSLAMTHRDAALFWSAALSVPLLLVAHLVQQQVPFVPGKMLAEPDHAKWLVVYYATALVPVFCASLYIGVTLVGFTADVHRLYFADLAASGVGAIVLLGVLYVVPPRLLPLIPMVPLGAGAIVVARNHLERAIGLVLLVACAGYLIGFGAVTFNEYKGILGTLRTKEISGATVIDERYGPMGYIQLVSSRSERTAPGLSAGTPFGISPPEQHALFVDGEKIGSLARALSAEDSKYLDWLLSALPYALTETPRTLVLQVAGGEAVMEALHHGAPRVRGVTTNPHFLDLMESYADYNGGLLGKEGVEVTVGESRAVAESSGERFDLVMMRGLDASGLSVSSTPGSSESYLLTVDAFGAYFRALTDHGMVAVTMRLSVPPWKAIRLLPTVATALRAAGVSAPDKGVMFIRDTFLGLLLVKPSGFTEAEVATARAWARRRSFDVSYVPGIRPDEVNQYTMILEETYTTAATECLGSEERCRTFIDAYLFDVSPTTDDRPYFGHVVTERTSDGLLDYQRRSVEALEAGRNPVSAPAGGEAVDSDPGGLDGDGEEPASNPGGLDGDGEVPASNPGGLDGDGEPASNPGGLDSDDGSEVAENPGGLDGEGDDGPAENPGGLDGESTEPAESETASTSSTETETSDESAEPSPGFLDGYRHVPVELWGAYMHWFTLAQALFFALLIVAVPLLAKTNVRQAPRKLRTLVYFACLGFGFMGAEMVLIRKLTLLLANPIFAVTIVLASILVGSGVGSAFAGRFKGRGADAIRIAAIGILTTVVVYIVALDAIVVAALGWPAALRGLLALVLVAPIALFLGFPFPTGMATLDESEASRSLVPWAWAINGATGVVAAVGAEILVTYHGFTVVLLAVLGCYSLAWFVFPGRGAASA